MRIVGVLCWYDEPVDQLAACVASFAPLLDHLVAVDGCYFLYPHSMTRTSSTREQSAVITSVCDGMNLPLTLHVPRAPYVENEVEKRNLSLNLARAAGFGEDDYAIVFDADMQARRLYASVRVRLEEEQPLVAAYGLAPSNESIPTIFRLLPDLRYGPSHWVVRGTVAGEQVFLRGSLDLHFPMAKPLDLTQDIRVDHHHFVRSDARRRDASDYYKRREFYKVERMGRVLCEGLDGEWVER